MRRSGAISHASSKRRNCLPIGPAQLTKANFRYLKRRVFKPYLKGFCMFLIGLYQKHLSRHTCLYTPTCSDWVATAVRTCRYADRIEVSVDGEYKEAQGTLTYRFLATGETELDYDFTMKEAVSPRQVGLTFALPADHTRLTWKRRGYWNYYPAGHIAALEGTADYMREDIPVCGLAGPDKEPDVPWELDQTEYGSNAFRSTKVNVYRARLESPATGRGFTVQSDGRQSVRCWREGDGFRLLVADYVNAGKGQYIEPHAALDYRPLRRGDRIRGRVAFRWEANGVNETNGAKGLRAVAHSSH